MILFPRREDKPKKGLIDDATAEQLKSAAAQNQVSGRVLPLKPAESEEEFRAIS